MSFKRSSNATQAVSGSVTASASTSATKATHIYASSIAVPIQTNVGHLETQLSLLSQRVATFIDRDVVLSRVDDDHPERVGIEAGDSSYIPIRKARVQSRLHVYFREGKTELRVYSQAQGSGASRGSDLVNIKNLICVDLYNIDEKEIAVRVDDETDYCPSEIGGGRHSWQQVTSAMGWVPHHIVIRKGHCYNISSDKNISIEGYLFHLMQLDDSEKLQRISDTRIFQAVILVTLPSKADQANVDTAQLSERAYNEMIRLQESLKGFVDLSRDVD